MKPLHALASGLLLAATLLVGGAAQAHGSQVGDIAIEHPYAMPSVPGARDGSAHLRALRNTGTTRPRGEDTATPMSW